MSAPYWTLDVPQAATPSLNQFTNKRDRFSYTTARRTWVRYLRDAWLIACQRRAFPPGPFEPPARARLVVYRLSPKDLDPDNLVGGLKPVIDALRRLGLLAADDPAALQLDVRQQKAPTGATRLILEPWKESPDAN